MCHRALKIWYNILRNMRVYLDNCCFNRPFDPQDQTKIRVETECKLLVQALMKTQVVEYVWSFMLDIETGKNRDVQRRAAIRAWKNGAADMVMPTTAIRERAREFMLLGVKPADSIHVACAEAANCDWFFTVDRGILSKLKKVGSMRVANPVEFVLEGAK